MNKNNEVITCAITFGHRGRPILRQNSQTQPQAPCLHGYSGERRVLQVAVNIRNASNVVDEIRVEQLLDYVQISLFIDLPESATL